LPDEQRVESYAPFGKRQVDSEYAETVAAETSASEVVQAESLAEDLQPNPALISEPETEPSSSEDIVPILFASEVVEFAVKGDSLTLADLENFALESNPTLAQAAASVDRSQGNWLQVGLYPNPTMGYQASEVGNEGHFGQQGVYFEQEFVTAGKLGLSRHAANHAWEKERFALQAQQQRVLTSVRISFYKTLIAREAVELSEKLLETSDRGLKATEAMLAAKQASQVDLLQSRIERNNARVLLRQAQNRLQAAWQRLTSFVGRDDLDQSQLVGNVKPDLKELDGSEILAAMLLESPQLGAAQQEVARARAAIERAQVEPTPNVLAQVGTQYDTSTNYTVANVQIGFALPIFNCNQGNIQMAQAELISAEWELERIRLDLKNRLAPVLENHQNARVELTQYSESILPDAKSSLDLVTQGYQQGQFGFLRFLTAQRTYFQTNLDYLKSQQKWWTASIQIEGMLLNGGLETP